MAATGPATPQQDGQRDREARLHENHENHCLVAQKGRQKRRLPPALSPAPQALRRAHTWGGEGSRPAWGGIALTPDMQHPRRLRQAWEAGAMDQGRPRQPGALRALRPARSGGWQRREGRPSHGQHLPGGLAEGKGQLGRRSQAPDERGGCAAPCASCGLTDGCTRDSGTAPRDPRTRRSWATNRSVCAGLSSELHAEPEPQSHPQATDHIVRLPTRRRRLKKQNSNGISTDKEKYSA